MKCKKSLCGRPSSQVSQFEQAVSDHAFNASPPIGMPVYSGRVYSKFKTRCLPTVDGERGSVS